MSIQSTVYDDPWINYNETLTQSRVILAWPKNIVFVTQLLDRVSSLDVYKNFPFAERMDTSSLGKVDWRQSVIVIDADAQLVHAPEPVRQLVQLDRRLRFVESFDTVFKPFRLVGGGGNYVSGIVWAIFILWSIAQLYNKFSRRKTRLVLTSSKA